MIDGQWDSQIRFKYRVGMTDEEEGDLILRLSNNAEIAWLKEQRDV
jgi:hypothetical protein